MRRLLVALALIPMLTLAGCAHDAGKNDKPETKPAASQKSDPNAPPPGPAWPGSAPKLPDGYEKETPEVAAEMAKYFYTSIYYGTYTKDWKHFDSMAGSECESCKEIKQTFKSCFKDDSAWARGNEPKYKILKNESFPDPHFYDIVLEISKPSYKQKCTGQSVQTFEPSKVKIGFIVYRKNGQWMIEEAGAQDENS